MNETTELIEKINALPSSDVFINRDLDPLAVFPAWFTTDDLKSLAAELTLANKKLAILQASNDHYADDENWSFSQPSGGCRDWYYDEGNGYDFARKTQEQIARLEGSNAEIQTR